MTRGRVEKKGGKTKRGKKKKVRTNAEMCNVNERVKQIKIQKYGVSRGKKIYKGRKHKKPEKDTIERHREK